ncbi:unnamed protein product, partial [Ectocarpus fasciculatus]
MMQGNIVQAMKLANDLDPTMLDRDRELRFGLLKQRLLELVRRGDADEALAFAAERLAPEGAQDPAILRQIEEAVTLLAFEVWRKIGARVRKTLFSLVSRHQHAERTRCFAIFNAAGIGLVKKGVESLRCTDAASSPLSGLLDMEQRHAAAGRLNAAVLQSQQQEKGPWLPDVLRQLVYTQVL